MSELDPSRRFRLTASRIGCLMKGDLPRIQNLFLEVIGDPRYQPEIFDPWLSTYGLAIEPIALNHYGKEKDILFEDRGVQYFDPERDYLSATLDASSLRSGQRWVTNVKTANPFADLEQLTIDYTPQILVEMQCRGGDQGSLLFVKGGTAPIEIPVYVTPEYRTAVFDTIDRFWWHVETLTPPFPLQFPKIVPPSEWRTIDLDRDAELPNWADEMKALLNEFDATLDTFRTHDHCKAEIKKLFPDDVGKLTHAQFVVSRSRSNAITIKRAKEHRA